MAIATLSRLWLLQSLVVTAPHLLHISSSKPCDHRMVFFLPSHAMPSSLYPFYLLSKFDLRSCSHLSKGKTLKEDDSIIATKIAAGHIAAKTIRLLIVGSQAGSLIGMLGENIEKFRNYCGATITVLAELLFLSQAYGQFHQQPSKTFLAPGVFI